MKKLLKFFSVITLIFSSTLSIAQTNGTEKNRISTDFYELYRPNTTEVVLVLFGGYPENAEDIEREFAITNLANKKNIAVAYLNYSGKLWLEENDKIELAESINELFKSNNLPTKKIYFGGFSSGGNMALLISNFLIENSNKIKPTGVFIVDSPIDLAALYQSAEKNIKSNFSEPAVQEAKWIISNLNENFGEPDNNLLKYEKYSVFTSLTNEINNLKDLKNTKIRFYTEPDTLWWKKNRKADYDQMNAYYIKKLSEKLKNSGFDQIEYIPTENKGYRANGERHPHSWSIVDKEELLQWMLEK
ncbi:hypothetical protein [Christiangramia forsetii]|uniref:Secreted protein n=2 Tax=Christiangramia forsetii TaxID=411153 RepID=A0LZN7_CHRFK|nr:hypothetical protein [Christiangramia forsetii]GGG46434.1 hypothetical protein GCM10011532_32880 [Christiangramia forsetii]CAL65832.1 secreted protein [Christiangramia forsetii KT0803]